MTLLLGDTGKSQIGTLKSFTVTPGTARETLLGTPLTLPTTEPATSQISFTVQESDLPTITPNVPIKYNASLIASGKIGAVASVVNYRVLKNGVNIAQAGGVSATATQFWNQTHWRTFDVVVGDVLEVRYWAAQADVTLDFYGLIIYLGGVQITKSNTILKDLNFSNVQSLPNFTTAFTTVTTSAFRVYPVTSVFIFDISSAITIPSIIPQNTSWLFRPLNGDLSVTTIQYVNATQRQYQKNWYPQTISFREVLR